MTSLLVESDFHSTVICPFYVVLIVEFLQILTEATVSRVLFADGIAGKNLIANGVEFIHGGKTMKVHANKEVILSAG